MNKVLLFFRNIIIVLLLFIAFSCSDPIPTVIVTSPQDGEEYFRDKDIEIKVILTDTKGKVFTVQLFVNNVFFRELSEAPYHFTIKAGEFPPGEHTITVQAGGGEKVFRKITIHKAAAESSDFVTFSNGEIPQEWIVNNWWVNKSEGFDDNFSLTAFSPKAQAKTSKTCNRILFYLKGESRINLHLDGKLWKTIDNSSDTKKSTITQEWKQYEFSCERMYHTFVWEFVGGNAVSLDAIRFYND